MTAAGKINAANLEVGQRIIVKASMTEWPYGVAVSPTKTGEGVQIVTVLAKDYRQVQSSSRRATGQYVIETSAGTIYAASIQTMFLAPEDAAGIKRAHVEANEIEEARNVELAKAEAEPVLAELNKAFSDGVISAATFSELNQVHQAAIRCTHRSYGRGTQARLALRHLRAIREAIRSARMLNDVPAPAAEPVQAKTLDASTPLAQSLIEADHAEALTVAEAAMTSPEMEALAVSDPYAHAAAVDRMITEFGVADEDEMDAECEAKGCDIREGDLECRVCGAEVTETDEPWGVELTPNSQAGKVDTMNKPSNSQVVDSQTFAQIKGILDGAAQPASGSTVVALLEQVWGRIREDHPELPEVVITTGSGEGAKWGHFRPESWKIRAEEGAAVTTGPGRRHELFLASEALAKGGQQVLQTMLHEAAHTLSRVREVKDTSRQGRWHNAQFRKAAEEMGLEHRAATADKSLGFSFVTLTESTKARYADLLARLEREIRLTGLLPAWLGGTGDEDERGGERMTKPKDEDNEGETKPKTGNVKTTCKCDEPNIIRMSKKVLEMRVVRCDDCEALFAERD